METELTFRTSVGGYRKDEVQEYVENINEQIFQTNRAHEEEINACKAREKELNARLSREMEENDRRADEQAQRIQEIEKDAAKLKEENERLKEELNKLESKWKEAVAETAKEQTEKKQIKDKLAREVLRLRNENMKLEDRAKEAEKNVGCRGDYESVRDVVTDVQYKIAEYVNVINKTQQSLAASYQSLNGIKKKITAEMEKEN